MVRACGLGDEVREDIRKWLDRNPQLWECIAMFKAIVLRTTGTPFVTVLVVCFAHDKQRKNRRTTGSGGQQVWMNYGIRLKSWVGINMNCLVLIVTANAALPTRGVRVTTAISIAPVSVSGIGHQNPNSD